MNVKESVLEELLEAKKNDEYVSGEKLASLCNVSRAAVWKAVNSLKADGEKIEAINNRGYKLLESNYFCQESIEECLKKIDADSKIKIRFYKTIDSTNTEAKRLLLKQSAEHLNKTVCIAVEQTAGRGRLGRKFYSPGKTGIYFSIIYAPQKNLESSKITALSAVGICRAIKNVYGIESKIKWVNDIYIEEKKVCGILTEGTANLETGLIDAAVIGIGINIGENDEIPEEVKKIAGAITHNTNDYKRSELAANAISEVIKIIEGTESEKNEAMQEYKKRSNLTGKKITVTPIINLNEGKYTCTVKGISDDAKLIVELEDGSEKELDSGEVSLHQ